jgi:Flp pilus assembly protein TadG
MPISPIRLRAMIGLMGMIVLVVDVGGMLYRRRQMVSAADAAALAAAQSCALGSAEAGSPAAQALQFAEDNVEGVPMIGGIVEADTAGCETGEEGHVTVEYQSDYGLTFAGIFGASEADVVGRATAEWGAAASGQPVPFIVTLGTEGGNTNVFCTDENGDPVAIDENTALGAECYVWFDNGADGGSFGGFGESVFGSLNLDKWDVDDSFNCATKDLPSNTHYAEVGGYDGDEPLDALNYPDPTWVCVGDGNSDSLYSGFESSEGKILVFPVTDGVILADNSGKVDKFNVVGFTALRLDEVYDATEAAGDSGSCTSVRPMNAGTSLNMEDVGINDGCFTTAPQTITVTSVTKDKNNQPGPQPQQNVDWMFVGEPSPTLTWLPAGPATEGQPYEIDYTWSNSGPCGPPPSNASGHCLAVSWQGIQFGNGPLGGMNLGVRAVRLCDLPVSGSCETTSGA